MTEPLNVKGKTILVVQAHPDDADFYCGATVARFASKGARVIYLVCTDGSKGTQDAQMQPERLAQIRREEQIASNCILGVTETRFLGFPDLECPQGTALREKLVREYRTIRPDILMTFDPWKFYELHPDHTAVGHEALYARLAAKMPLSFQEHLHEGLRQIDDHEILLFKTDNPDTWYEAEGFLDVKRKALLCHKSQFGESVFGSASEIDRLLGHALALNPKTGKVSEAFKRITIDAMQY
jgi:LmbE family N-acetylglucosaminyl deacetylase